MVHPLARVSLVAAAGFAAATALAADKKDKVEAMSEQETRYICPNAGGGAIDCYLHAVEHLYTMCRQVKSIEIIEFGYEHATDGVNGAKSQYCVDKQKNHIARPYQLALREATGNRTATDQIRALYELWQQALAELMWIPGEKDDEYKTRVARPYEAFSERATIVRTSLSVPAAAAPASGPGTTAAAPSAKKSTN